MPYTIVDSINDEVSLLKELEDQSSALVTKAIYREQRYSLERIVKRFNEGTVYSLGRDKDGLVLYHKRSARKTLREEYPALQKLAEQYDLFENLINSEPKED